ncbi:hypothetical protein Btru_066186 [Bulinus truncatus]|nr:hypothetical protein Btru_066186 [Bulinus truncatus]
MNNSDFTNEKNGSKRSLLQNVDDETRTAITALFYETMDLSSVGIGKDAKGLNHHKAEVCSIKRIENPVVFQNYHSQKKQMVKLYDEKRRVYADIASLNGSKGKVLTSCKFDDTVKSDLNETINEFYLFHGTKPGAVNQIFTNGFDPAFAKNTAMLGKGIYAAEKASKADQYTDDRFNRTPPGTELTMFLTRMLMGNAFLCDHTHKYFKSRGSPKFIRPPCVTCLEDNCSSTEHVFHDSVLADGLWKYREFVVYEKCQAYPEYIITYKRL